MKSTQDLYWTERENMRKALEAVLYVARDNSIPPSRRLETLEEVAEKALQSLKEQVDHDNLDGSGAGVPGAAG